jgi:ABC-type dipeptide/oligopeptide/nickel transport system permease subunit
MTVPIILRDGRILFGGCVVAVIGLLTLAAPLVSPYDPLQVFSGLRNAPIGTIGHLLGTDQAGRDILSRVLWGGRVSLVIGTMPVAASLAIGTCLGLIAAYYGRWVEFLILRFMEILFAFPLILLAILAAAVLGKGMLNAMTAMTIVVIPYVIRAVHAAAKSTMGLTYVEAAIIRGAGPWRIMLSEILPNIIASLVIFATSVMPIFIIFSAGLSYLGLAIEPPTPDWGIMIAEGQQVIQTAPHVSTVPGLVLLAVSISMNLIGDGVEDALNPSSRRRAASADSRLSRPT